MYIPLELCNLLNKPYYKFYKIYNCYKKYQFFIVGEILLANKILASKDR